MNIAVIFGGKSPEHEISRRSAANVLRWLDKDKYEVSKIGITKKGRWYLTEAGYEEIEDGTWEQHDGNKQVCFPSDPVVHGMLIFETSDHASVKRIDVAIPVLHGAHGEDGDIQGLLNLSEIPYVGPGVAASANGMDKSITKKLVATTGIRQADYVVINKHEYNADREKELARVKEKFGGSYTLFVKPASAGSSVGASGIKGEEELSTAVELALKYDSKALIEEKIVGREIEVAVLGNDAAEASDPGEIISAGEFYDYDSKYSNPESMTRIVKDLSREKIDDIRSKALQIYKVMDCKGLSRVDFFYTEDGEVVFNEINTLPGFTNISMYPVLWNNMGISGTELLGRLIDLALEEHSDWK